MKMNFKFIGSEVKNIFVFFALACLFVSCRTTRHFDSMGTETEKESRQYKNRKEEEEANYAEMQEYLVQEKMKEVDVPKTIVYVDRPVYYPAEKETSRPNLYGKDAVKKSTEGSVVTPHDFTHGTMWYDFDDEFTYEIYCQPYRVTDLVLQPGEQLIEMPFLSEEKVWEIGAGVSRANDVDTQHFFLKPAYSGLVTSFILITDRRVYHILLKSFKDCYMTQVKWKYPNTMPFNIKTEAMKENVNRLSKETFGVDPKYLSFDYKMSYSMFKKPYWLPTRVYDDGRRTYITMNDTVLHMTTPVLFNKSKERINYSVDRNLIVINELIEKVTMQVGKQRVVIRKKSYVEPKATKVKEVEPDVKLKEEEPLPPPSNAKGMIHSDVSFGGKKDEPKEEKKEQQGVVFEIRDENAR